MIDFEELFGNLIKELKGQLKRLPGTSKIKVFCGINNSGGLRISFMSSIQPPKITSTKGLKVSILQEADKVFWTSFDLMNSNAKPIFFALCEDLNKVIEENPEERAALNALRDRFFAWQNLFKQDSSRLTDEKIIGLLGELFFLKNYLIPKLGPEAAINAWSGPEGASKDFSTENTWFEIKAVSLANNTVKINSLTQLASPMSGYLVILRYEVMSEQFDDSESNVIVLFKRIMSCLDNDVIKSIFVSKLMVYGFDINGSSYSKKYRVDSMSFYSVDANFPRLTEEDIKYPEIDKLEYSLLINSLEKYKVEV